MRGRKCFDNSIIKSELNNAPKFFFMPKSYLKICPVISASPLGYFDICMNKEYCENFQNLCRLCTFSEVRFFRYRPSLRSLRHSNTLDFFIAFVPYASGSITRVSLVLFHLKLNVCCLLYFTMTVDNIRTQTACVCHSVDRWRSSVEIAASRSCKVLYARYLDTVCNII